MIRVSLLFFFLFLSPGVTRSEQVIDLGKLEIQGKARGPDVKVVDADQLTPSVPARWLRMKLEKLEAELLVSEPAPSELRGAP